TSAVSGNITVKGHNSCGDGDLSTKVITVNPLPAAAGTISGDATVCQGQNSVTYTVPTITNATSYVWTLPSGANGTSTTNSITVNYGTSAVSGNITVKGHNSCGDGDLSTKVITVNPLPAAAGTISGDATVCQGQNSVTYTVPTITNATSYTWTYSGTGATITGTTNNITISFAANATSGNLTVRGNNSCGSGEISSNFSITVNTMPNTSNITGNSSPFCDEMGVQYSVTLTSGSSYLWDVPNGATITSGEIGPNNNSIIVNFGSSNGNITVIETNSADCPGLPKQKVINLLGCGLAADFTGTPQTICQNETVSFNSISTGTTENTSYSWNFGDGANPSTANTQGPHVVYYNTPGQKTVSLSVTEGVTDTKTITDYITVNPLPDSAGTISGEITACQGQNSVVYTVPAITNATSYVWTLPSGATGTSTTNSITVNYGVSASSGNITVKGTNSCGDGATSVLGITIIPAPPANAGNDTVICPGSSITLIASGGNSYLWSNGITQGVPFYPLSTEIYTVTVSDGFCTTIDSIIVTISTPPAAPEIYQDGNDLHSTSPIGNQWYFDYELIPGETSQIFTPTMTGYYFVILTDTLGCISDTSNVLYVAMTGFSDLSNNNNIHIYPNPVSNELIIEIKGNNEMLNFEILNAIGQLVFKGNLVEKTTVQTSNFTPGVYLIKLENGKTFEFKKILKL
ncbi:MAG: PKD domain-containing protein, partial [Bacteroidales bacterium]|nr:PKD domain-containing protein [Bacteroidales bacterium]